MTAQYHDQAKIEKLKTSEFTERLQAGEIKTVKINSQGTLIQGELRKAGANEETKYQTNWTGDKNDLNDKIKAINSGKKTESLILFDVENPSFMEGIGGQIIIWIVFFILLAGVWIFIMRQAGGGNSKAMDFGKSKARRVGEDAQRVTFDDVAGVDEAKEELSEIVDFLKNPRKYASLGAKIPKGVLLLGPPGSGKTLLSRAIAGEAGVPFFHISGSDFVEMFVGVGASRVRDLFSQAKANKPCIIFIDEIDAVGRQRFAGVGGGHDEREQTLNQLLVEMDGFESNSGIILIAATNRADVLDPALLRPGRFDRRIVVDNPDLNGRVAILNVHIKGKPLADDVDLNILARRTTGFSGADLANMLNEAALLAARNSDDKINMAHLEASIDRVIAGPERKGRALNEKERGIIAVHEVGHALMAEKLELADPLHKISILPRGMALGYTLSMPEEDTYLASREELLQDITVLLGGRAAEDIFFSDITTGAQNDLQRATRLSMAMITEYGMSEVIGQRVVGKDHSQIFLGRDMMDNRDYSEETAEKIDAEIQRILNTSYNLAKDLITEHKKQFEDIVERLLKTDVMTSDEFKAILYGTEETEEKNSSVDDGIDTPINEEGNTEDNTSADFSV